MRIKHLAALLVAAVLFVGLLGAATAQSPVSEFDTILLEKLIATDTVNTHDLAVTGTLDAGTLNATGTTALAAADFAGNVTMQGTLSIDGALALSTDLNLVPQTPISVTAGATITPTGAFQLIESSGTVTPTTIAAGGSGETITLMNITNTTINLADSGDLVLSAAWAGGQWDTLTLRYYGVKWIEIARSNN